MAFSALLSLLLFAGTPEALACDEAGLRRAVTDYAQATQSMDFTALSSRYLPDGVLSQRGGQGFKGPAAIAAFLQGFSAYRVLSDQMTVEQAAALEGGAWRATGAFHQRVRVPAGDTVEASGHFEGIWVCRAGDWKIRSLETY